MFEMFFLSFVVWLTYWHVINAGFVSDDIEGLQNYDGKLKKFDYGHLNKWLLYKLLEKSPRRNHLFSIILHNANTLLLFSFLITFIPIKLALYSCILFAVYPVCIQSVAWISSRGYPISLFFCLLGFNLLSLFPVAVSNSFLFALVTILYGCVYYVSIEAQFAVLATFVLQVFFGNYFFSAIGAVISIVAGLGIVKEVIKTRTDVFKEQNLARSTMCKPQKIIVAIKSLAYYTRLCFFPKRLGLYHKFEYHYSDKTEKEDKWFWLGFVMLLGFITGFIFGDTIVKFAILWYLAYVFIFLNWITIHQFVSERYVYIASVGICVLTAYGVLILDTLLFSGYPVLFTIIASLYLMRSWVHMPTYNEEVSFYQSNVWNFPDSEVAFGNLGVTYMKCQLLGSAVDMWQIAIKINPSYDVAHYNISSVLKQRGDFVNARESLKKAVESPQCHFKELWTKELTQLEHEINYVNELNAISAQLSEMEKNPSKFEQARAIRKQLDEINNLHKKFEETQKHNLTVIQQEEDSLKTKLIKLNEDKANFSKPLSTDELIKARDNNFNYIKEAVNNMLKEANIVMKKSNFVMPPEGAFPNEPKESLCWRMGAGETYLDKWNKLSPAEQFRVTKEWEVLSKDEQDKKRKEFFDGEWWRKI